MGEDAVVVEEEVAACGLDCWAVDLPMLCIRRPSQALDPLAMVRMASEVEEKLPLLDVAHLDPRGRRATSHPRRRPHFPTLDRRRRAARGSTCLLLWVSPSIGARTSHAGERI